MAGAGLGSSGGVVIDITVRWWRETVARLTSEVREWPTAVVQRSEVREETNLVLAGGLLPRDLMPGHEELRRVRQLPDVPAAPVAYRLTGPEARELLDPGLRAVGLTDVDDVRAR